MLDDIRMIEGDEIPHEIHAHTPNDRFGERQWR